MYVIQLQLTDIEPASRSTDPVTIGPLHGSHLSAQFSSSFFFCVPSLVVSLRFTILGEIFEHVTVL